MLTSEDQPSLELQQRMKKNSELPEDVSDWSQWHKLHRIGHIPNSSSVQNPVLVMTSHLAVEPAETRASVKITAEYQESREVS